MSNCFCESKVQGCMRSYISSTFNFLQKKWDAMVYNQKDMKIVIGDLSELEMEQDRKDLEEIQVKMMKMNSKFLENANSLRGAAEKLDQVWWNCKKARHFITGAVLGGILMVDRGIASLMTAGAAAHFLAPRAVAKVGTVIYEQIKNSKEIKKAEDLLSELLAGISKIDDIARSKLGTKGQKNLLYLRYVAQNQELNDPIKMMLSELSLNGYLSISKIIWDTEMLGSTIRYVVENKESEAAEILREKAYELEKLALSNEKITSSKI